MNNDDIKVISKKWLGDNTNFIKLLYKKPYHELANRPIYLTLLLVLFERTQTLPLSPFEIYREAVYLIIRDWDDGRDIVRLSKYANFNVRKKLDFLQEIAFYLTYQIKSNVFSSKLLFEIYKIIHNKYSLPRDEIDEVIAEIESHNGIISEAGYETFEFSHLTLQEYLCAEYLISLPYSRNTITYFFERPDPLAIAICISKDSGLWLSNLLLNENLDISNYTTSKTKPQNSYNRGNFENSLSRLLSRLIDEAPIFTQSFELGATIVYLIPNFQNKDQIFGLVRKLLTIPNVSNSTLLFLNDCTIEIKEDLKLCIITRNLFSRTPNFIKLPYYERINLSTWRKVEIILKKNTKN
ncbi:NACHT domain-containing protein [Spirosoma luteum]|uniref:NACHT domain-containing protein n=1 Tax=Spirosoma luteum TaxID=431553 RepID=UPI00036689CB|nr:hypothetical protein [Spirosoma luteum]